MPDEHATHGLSYCAAEIRRHDRDRFLTALFAPSSKREDLFALYAFNLEIARIRETVREPFMGLIRLQWWRDAIEEIHAGSPRRHPVVEALGAATRRSGLPREPFLRLLKAREQDMSADPPADLAGLAAYAEGTSAPLIELALLALGGPLTEPAILAARHIGIAWALTGLVRAIPFHAATRRSYLPRQAVDREGLDLGGTFELRSSPSLCRIVREIMSEARRHHRLGRDGARALPRRLLPALLPAVLVELHASRIAKAGYDPFAVALRRQPEGRVWRLAYRFVLGRI